MVSNHVATQYYSSNRGASGGREPACQLRYLVRPKVLRTKIEGALLAHLEGPIPEANLGATAQHPPQYLQAAVGPDPALRERQAGALRQRRAANGAQPKLLVCAEVGQLPPDGGLELGHRATQLNRNRARPPAQVVHEDGGEAVAAGCALS